MSFTDSASSWIWAAKNGDPIASNDPSANLNQHDYNDNFQIDLTKAAGGNSLNPFVSNAATTSTAPAGSSPSSSSPSSSGGSTGGSSNGGSSGGSSDSGEEATKHMRVIAHGIIMSLAFLYVISHPLMHRYANYLSESFSLLVLSPSASSPSKAQCGSTPYHSCWRTRLLLLAWE